ncbi:MAG: DUF885 domain-containing protein [Haliangiales bacterium]
MATQIGRVIKRAAKWLGLALLAALVVGGGFAAHEWYAEKPIYFNNLLNRELIKIAMEQPEMLTSLGFLESVGIKGHNAELDDASPESSDKVFAKAKRIRDTVKRYADDDLDDGERLSKQVVMYLLDFLGEAEKFRYHNFPVNQLFGVQNGFPSFMDSMHRVEEVEDAENYIARLSKVKIKFGQVLEGLKIREEKDILPPRFVVDRVLDEMRTFVATPAKENILYTSLAGKIDKAGSFSDADKERVLAAAEGEITATVYPAYQEFIDYFEALRPKTTTDDGVWRLPDGDELYAVALKLFTTTDYTPDEVHQLGLDEVARIQAEILTILAAEGYDTSAGFSDAIDALAADDKFYYPDTDAGREQILADYRTILDEIDAGIDEAFRVRPDVGVEVVRIPEFKEKTAPGAYYEPPALDGSRPGRFFANLYDVKATPKYSMRTLAYHEGIPGHHFQIAISLDLEGLPFIRRIPMFTAYTEGWALYTERLAWELGFQDDPFDNVGRLQAELFRAVRLVVDTGIHAKRWTREEAIEYMRTNTGMAESDVTAEVERYIVMPGQATSYKVGMMKILELREAAKAALGDKFDLRDFHDVVLGNGAVPLDILEQLVDDYVERVSAES